MEFCLKSRFNGNHCIESRFRLSQACQIINNQITKKKDVETGRKEKKASIREGKIQKW